MYKVGFLLFIAVFFSSCTLSNRDIENHWWKFGERRKSSLNCDSIRINQHIDVMYFDKMNHYTLIGDTIYKEELPYAEIISRYNKESVRMEIVQFETKDTILYFGK